MIDFPRLRGFLVNEGFETPRPSLYEQGPNLHEARRKDKPRSVHLRPCQLIVVRRQKQQSTDHGHGAVKRDKSSLTPEITR